MEGLAGTAVQEDVVEHADAADQEDVVDREDMVDQEDVLDLTDAVALGHRRRRSTPGKLHEDIRILVGI